MFDNQRARLKLEEISGALGGRPVRVVDEYLHVFNVELEERTALLKVLRPYLPIVTVVFFSKMAGEEQHSEFITQWRSTHE